MTLRLLAARAGVVATIAMGLSLVVAGAGVWNDRLGPVGAIAYAALVLAGLEFRRRGKEFGVASVSGLALALSLVFLATRTTRSGAEETDWSAGLNPFGWLFLLPWIAERLWHGREAAPSPTSRRERS